MNILDQRCSNHALREAAVQCPSCKRFFCRECVTEHAGRMICVACVNAVTRDAHDRGRSARARWAVTALAGILIAWFVFYYLGLTLARIPSEFHAQTGTSSSATYQVGRPPGSAADGPVGLFECVGRAGPGVRRGRGRPPHLDTGTVVLVSAGHGPAPPMPPDVLWGGHSWRQPALSRLFFTQGATLT
jgi:hypothetical protein